MAISVSRPHYLLFSETSRHDESGRWRFRFRSPEGREHFEASDTEPEVRGERLELLTLVRALESLDQPSRVTLMTSDPYLRQGICFGLPEWRANDWRWEYFGKMVPIKHADLWQRMDQAMRFHQVEFCKWRIDGPHVGPSRRSMAADQATSATESRTTPARDWLQLCCSVWRLKWRICLLAVAAWWRPWLSKARCAGGHQFRFS
jgi:ribonuclease HI